MAVTVALCCVGAPGLAANYYVDYSAGNDANDGTSASRAWKHAPGMAAYAGGGGLAPGDTVYFDRADTWPVSGTQGLYLTGGVSYVGNTWGSGSRATLRASANIDSAVVRFRDHPSIATVFRGFEVDANSKVTNGIEMNHSFYAGPLTGATKRVQDVEVHHIWSRTSQGQFKYGIIVSNHGGRNGEVANVEILDSVIHDTSRDALPIYPGDANADCIVRNVLVRGNTVYNTGQDPDYAAGAGIIVKGRVIDAIVERNYIAGTQGAGIFINGNESNHFGSGPTNIHIRYNTVNVNTVHGSIRVYDGSSGSDPKDVRIYGNLVYDNTRNAGLLLDNDLGSDNSIRIYNNTFFEAPIVLRARNARFPVLEMHNNIVYSTGRIPLTVDPQLTAHSHNLFFGGPVLVRTSSTTHSAATIAQFEADALAVNPSFVDSSRRPTGLRVEAGVGATPNATGLALASNSPAISAGRSLDASYAQSINGQSRAAGPAWDLGAYQLSRPSPPRAPTDVRVVQ